MKKGLVVEGGGIRAVFVSGCLDALLENNIKVDYLIGVSAGIANSASFISEQKGRNLEIMQKFVNDKRYMGFGNFFNPKNRSYFGIDFTFNEIPTKHIPFDYDKFHSFDGEVIAVLSNVKTGEAHYENIIRNEYFNDYIIASCSLPYMFPEREIKGENFLDGGICDPVPIRKAIEDGCDKILCLLTREKGYRKKDSFSPKILSTFSKKKNFFNAMKNRARKYNNSLELVESLEKKGKVFAIRPQNTKKFSRTEKNIKKIEELYYDGYNIINENIDAIKKYFES